MAKTHPPYLSALGVSEQARRGWIKRADIDAGRGQPQVHLGHSLVATGLNFLRLGEWFAGMPPR